MGTWGSGNFDSDSALDRMGELIDQLSSEVSEAVAGDDLAIDEGFEEIMAVVETIRVLCTHAAGMPPKSKIIKGWKKRLLCIFDEEIDGLDPKPGFKEERRAKIVETLDGSM